MYTHTHTQIHVHLMYMYVYILYIHIVLCSAVIEDGLENESLIVWYRVSAFPWFRKLYAHPEENKDLPAGNYSIFITYSIHQYTCVSVMCVPLVCV